MMLLKELKYSQFEGAPNEWKVEGASFDNINLIVGKNATGKSRLISVINYSNPAIMKLSLMMKGTLLHTFSDMKTRK